MRKIELHIRYFLWAFLETFKPVTYDLVKYKGRKYHVKSSLSGYGFWDLLYPESLSIAYYRINQKKLKVNYLSFKRFVSVFRDKIRFQKQNWQFIDLTKPFLSRISYKSSENIKF